LPGAELLFEYATSALPDDVVVICDETSMTYALILIDGQVEVLRSDPTRAEGYEKLFIPGLCGLSERVVELHEINIIGNIWEVYYIKENSFNGQDVHRLYFTGQGELVADSLVLNQGYQDQTIRQLTLYRHSLWNHFMALEQADRVLVYGIDRINETRSVRVTSLALTGISRPWLGFFPGFDDTAMLAVADALPDNGGTRLSVYGSSAGGFSPLFQAVLPGLYQAFSCLPAPQAGQFVLVCSDADHSRLVFFSQQAITGQLDLPYWVDRDSLQAGDSGNLLIGSAGQLATYAFPSGDLLEQTMLPAGAWPCVQLVVDQPGGLRITALPSDLAEALACPATWLLPLHQAAGHLRFNPITNLATWINPEQFGDYLVFPQYVLQFATDRPDFWLAAVGRLAADGVVQAFLLTTDNQLLALGQPDAARYPLYLETAGAFVNQGWLQPIMRNTGQPAFWISDWPASDPASDHELRFYAAHAGRP